MQSEQPTHVTVVESFPLLTVVIKELVKCAYPNSQIHTVLKPSVELTSEIETDVVVHSLSGSLIDHEHAIRETEFTFPYAKHIFLTELDLDSVCALTNPRNSLVIDRSWQFGKLIDSISQFDRHADPMLGSDNKPNEHQSHIQYPGAAKPLTKKQVQVMEYAIKGYTVKQTGKEMNLSPDTVKAHIKQAYERLKARNRSQAICNYFEAKQLASRMVTND